MFSNRQLNKFGLWIPIMKPFGRNLDAKTNPNKAVEFHEQ